ncbi:hypothetical protein, partial [Vibrio furnissii]|uniref:hypothetical protein n=2 Tax=Vibrio furnissii TaxID=29494 RepID=UPI001EEA0E11
RYASGGKMEKSIRELAKEVGLVIPKPEAKADFVIKGIGRRRGEEALIYRIPSHSEKAPFYEKGVTLSEFQLAYSHLRESGYLTRTWFNNNLSACAKEGACNFTTIGGVLCILGVAEYVSKATYQLKA